MFRTVAGRRHSPEVELPAARLGGRADRRPPRQVARHQLGMGSAATREEAVGPAVMARDQDRGECVRVTLSVSGVGTAPWQQPEQKLVVAPVGKVDRLTPLDSGRLAGHLGAAFTLFDNPPAPQAGAGCLTAAPPYN